MFLLFIIIILKGLQDILFMSVAGFSSLKRQHPHDTFYNLLTPLVTFPYNKSRFSEAISMLASDVINIAIILPINSFLSP